MAVAVSAAAAPGFEPPGGLCAGGVRAWPRLLHSRAFCSRFFPESRSPAPVTGHVSPSLIALQDLRLEAACALLGKRLGAAVGTAPARDGTAFLQAIIDGLCELSLRDPLTGVSNRRQLMPVLESELDRVVRAGDTALLLMIDIDHFKRINDEYGHATGDQVLRHVAQRLAHCIRPMDTLVRYGGEEFAIVLPTCPLTYGMTVAERMRGAVASSPIQAALGQEVHVTISIGGAYAQQWMRSTPHLWIQRTDEQLYRSKHAGRNCIHIEPVSESVVSPQEKNYLLEHLAVLGTAPDGTALPPSSACHSPSPSRPPGPAEPQRIAPEAASSMPHMPEPSPTAVTVPAAASTGSVQRKPASP